MSEFGLELRNSIGKKELNRLRKALGDGPVLIVTHDSPDPDALASGKGLAFLFQEAWGIQSELQYAGLVARAENRAMLTHLTPEWKYVRKYRNLSRFSAIVMVDSQPQAGNNSLPMDTLPDIVLDHHRPIRESLDQVSYFDVRPDIGASVSMVFQYLDAAKVIPNPILATAMWYGLHTDTRGLAREASEIDEVVYVKLLTWIDRQKLILVEQAGLSRDYFRAFNKGLQAARVFGKVVVAYLGDMPRPDLPAEMADVLIRLETARAVLCYGTHSGTLHISLRTEPFGLDAGALVQQLLVSLGTAGGHGTLAGGQVLIGDQEVSQLVVKIQRRFLDLMDETIEGEPLL